MKLSIKDFFSKCDQIHRKLQIWFTFPEEILNGKLHFCAVVKGRMKSTKFCHYYKCLLKNKSQK